jgi:cytoskeletal protein CcmA (bactofilin family)
MVFGAKRQKRDIEALPREDVIGSLYPETVTNEVEVAPAPPPPPEPVRETPPFNPNESVIDPHARFNGQYASDRDLRIEGEAQGEIECQGTLVISPQARVRSAIKAHNVLVNGDYEGDVDCGGRFEIGSTGRVKGTIRTQVLVVHEGAHWDGSVIMSNATPAPRALSLGSTPPQQLPRPVGGNLAPRAAGASIFSKQDREAAPAPVNRPGQ